MQQYIGVKLINAKQRVKDMESPKFVEYSWSGKCQLKSRWVVRVRGRLGKDNPHAKLYRRGGPLHRYSSQDIRPEHAAHFDVYMHKRTDVVPVAE